MTNENSFQTFTFKLNTKYKSLDINLNKNEFNNIYVNEILISELKSIFYWCQLHLEISTIYISSDSDFTFKGLNPNNIENQQLSDLIVLNQSLEKLITFSKQLPQTIIMDISLGAENIGIEFSLLADLLISHQDCKLKFNFLSQGLAPRSGAISILSCMLSPAHVKNWILGDMIVEQSDLLAIGHISSTYNSKTKSTMLEKLLFNISKQSSICRVQTKLAFYEIIKEELIKKYNKEKTFSNAALSIGDWKNCNKKTNLNDVKGFLKEEFHN
ncbi:MAG: hypothetical protein HOJ35_08805 [Bdellovibrionales bacterium]|jgi:enoyl-CoA hydratase/carnithine racemase|nr:hypothetical protein [Bdellovibrionales bacterium]